MEEKRWNECWNTSRLNTASPQFLILLEYYSTKLLKNNSLKSMQVLCSSVAIFFTQCSQPKSWQIIHLLGYFTELSTSRNSQKNILCPTWSCQVLTLHGVPPFPLVSLILGCFIKVLHQIWNNKRLRGKLMQSGGSQRCQITIQEKCVYVKHDYRCNAIPIPRSSLWLHIWGPPRNYWKQL